jgi:hypothetical protein
MATLDTMPAVASRRFRSVGVAVVCVVVFVTALAVTPPRGQRSMRRFDPDRLAALELGMWQAYYAKQRVRLFALLVTTLREQYRYSWAVATREAFHLARAAATFGDLRSGYDVVLPDLEQAYGTAKSWMHAGFDPNAVAHAELAWWAARRVPGENSPEHVGALIADEYSLLYETAPGVVADAARLRAEAAALRDQQAQNPDWDTIGQLLQRSYRELLSALSVVNV